MRSDVHGATLRAKAARPAAAVVWILMGVASGTAQVRYLDVERSSVTVHLSTPGDAPGAGPGFLVEAPLAEGSVDDTDTPHFAIVINVRDLRIVDPGRPADERQRIRARILGPEGLDEPRFSRVTYHSLAIDRRAGGDWFVQGEMELHGRFLPLNLRAIRKGDRFSGTTTLGLTEFGIAPLQLAGAPLPIGREVRVDFDVVLEGR